MVHYKALVLLYHPCYSQSHPITYHITLTMPFPFFSHHIYITQDAISLNSTLPNGGKNAYHYTKKKEDKKGGGKKAGSEKKALMGATKKADSDSD